MASRLESPRKFEIRDPKETVDRLTRFIRTYTERSGARILVVGMSGGLDSSVAASLSALAVGGRRVIGVSMPESETHNPRNVEDAKLVASNYGISFRVVDITSIVEAFKSVTKMERSKSLLTAYGNVKARSRMVILYYHANINNGIVVGTGDKSETMLGYYCYDSRTRALTTEGLKSFVELRPGDLVFSLNPTSRMVEERPVNNVHVFDYEGPMVRFVAKRTDLLVTPNHRMLVAHNHGFGQIAFEQANRLLDRPKVYFPMPNPWTGNVHPDKFINPSDFFEGSHLSFNAGRLPERIPTDLFFYLTGIYIGDGYAQHSKVQAIRETSLRREEYLKSRCPNGRFASPSNHNPALQSYDAYSTYLAIPEKDKARQRVEETLEKAGIDFRGYPNVIKVASRQLYEAFAVCGAKAAEKRIPRWMLNYPGRQLYSLLAGMLDSDGSNETVYYTISEQLALDTIELCAKLGMHASIHTRPPRESVYQGKTIRSGQCFEISIAHRIGSTILGRERVSTVYYNGIVWCPDVPPMHNLLVERNGKFTFSGNTKYGDGACDIQPLADLYKSSVRSLARHLRLPSRVYSKPSSPELWPGQTAVKELGLDYDKLDEILWGLERWISPMEIAKEVGVPSALVGRVRKRWLSSEHKRRVPLAPKLGFRTVGMDFRLPYTN